MSHKYRKNGYFYTFCIISLIFFLQNMISINFFEKKLLFVAFLGLNLQYNSTIVKNYLLFYLNKIISGINSFASFLTLFRMSVVCTCFVQDEKKSLKMWSTIGKTSISLLDQITTLCQIVPILLRRQERLSLEWMITLMESWCSWEILLKHIPLKQSIFRIDGISIGRVGNRTECLLDPIWWLYNFLAA